MISEFEIQRILNWIGEPPNKDAVIVNSYNQRVNKFLNDYNKIDNDFNKAVKFVCDKGDNKSLLIAIKHIPEINNKLELFVLNTIRGMVNRDGES